VNARRAREEALHRQLLAELAAAGCFRSAPLRTGVFALLIVAAYATAYACLLSGAEGWLRLAALAIGAIASVQAGFLAHEAGHGAVCRDRRAADLLGQIFHTFLSGLAYSYFQHIHRLHHPHCNDRARDPDANSGVVSMHPQSARAKRGLGRLISRHQAWLVWLLIGLQGFSLKLDGLTFVLRYLRRTRADQVFLLLHATLWLVLPVAFVGAGQAWLNYALMTLFIGFYVGSIFIVNHVGTRVVEPGEALSHFAHEISVTRNLGATRLHDLFFGGVNNHIEHHLFPAMPSARLPQARRITREFCRRHGIAYREMSWLGAAREVTAHFRAMAALVP
jgi:fatty acid desaturase